MSTPPGGSQPAAAKPSAVPATAWVRTALAPRMDVAAFQWPWDIASKGADHLSAHQEVANDLASGGQAIVNSAQGPGIVGAVSSKPSSTASTSQVLDDGLFSQALASVRSDHMLRTVFIGWAGGAQVGLFGGGGGGGVAYDILDRSDQAAVTYGLFSIGIGAQAGAGLLLGAMSRRPHDLNASTAVWEFGASLLGVGALVSVIMSDEDLSLIGITINVSVGGGFSSATGYGSISAG